MQLFSYLQYLSQQFLKFLFFLDLYPNSSLFSLLLNFPRKYGPCFNLFQRCRIPYRNQLSDMHCKPKWVVSIWNISLGWNKYLEQLTSSHCSNTDTAYPSRYVYFGKWSWGMLELGVNRAVTSKSEWKKDIQVLRK